jgi:hypothetical protein
MPVTSRGKNSTTLLQTCCQPGLSHIVRTPSSGESFSSNRHFKRTTAGTIAAADAGPNCIWTRRMYG